MSRDRQCDVCFLHTALTVIGVAHKIFEIEAQTLERWLYASYFERCGCLDASTITQILDRLNDIENTLVDYPLRDLHTDTQLLPHMHTILKDYLLVEPCTTYDVKVLKKELRNRQTEILYYEGRLLNTPRLHIRSHLPLDEPLPAWDEPPWGAAFEA